MFEARRTDELIQIASAGGGFELTAAPRTTAELIQIASAAAASGAQLIFRGLGARPTAELIQIASAGKGRVVFGN